MNFNKPVPPREPKLLPERAAHPAEYEKLKTSQAYRSEHGRSRSESLGTAVRRSKRGLIYDAPLGLKF